LLGTLKDRYKRLWRQASLPMGVLLGNLLRGLVYGGLREKDERGSRDGASHSKEAQKEGLLY
jgi:hypothetical protein